jgi:hypothetical protein
VSFKNWQTLSVIQEQMRFPCEFQESADSLCNSGADEYLIPEQFAGVQFNVVSVGLSLTLYASSEVVHVVYVGT